jgi:beta-glucosidase
VVAIEGRARHNDQLKAVGQSTDLFAITYFAPNINLVRDVRWGRTQETYGECPHLTSRMGTAFVQGVQNQSIRPSLSSNNPYLSGLAMLKHYLAYDLESSFAVGGHSARCVLELACSRSVIGCGDC